MKTAFTYLFIAIFAFAFGYKTVRYLAQPKMADETAYTDVDCANEKENSFEEDEITDFYYTHFFDHNQFLHTEKIFSPVELVVHFTSADYKNTIYSPPELLS